MDSFRAVKLLVLGGTKFLGRATVDAALQRGHEVTLFNRGRTNPELFPEAEKLRGDRANDLSALSGRTWDAVVDTSAYVPQEARASAEALANGAGYYLFISSVSVYADLSQPVDEESPLDELARGPARRSPARGLLELRPPQGPVRAGGGRRLRRPDGNRPPGSDRRPTRPHRPVHLLAPSRCARRRGPRSQAARRARFSSSTSAISASGSSTSASNGSKARSTRRIVT